MKVDDFLTGLCETTKPPDRTATLSAPAPEPETATSGEGEPAAAPVSSAGSASAGTWARFAIQRSLWNTSTEHFLDQWLVEQNWSQWRYEAPGHLVGPDAGETADDFDSLPGFDQWLAVVKADLRRRCRVSGHR
jgi:hypothetical protein